MFIPNIGSLQKKEIVFSASTRALVETTFVSNTDKQLARVQKAAAAFPLAIALNSSRIMHLGHFARYFSSAFKSACSSFTLVASQQSKGSTLK